MKGGYGIALLLTVLLAGGFFYYTASAICPIPLEYRIGVLDERFGITKDEAKLAATGAESVWEDATGINLFTYNETADFAINFIFDDRQALVDAEGNFKDRLEAAENVNESIASQYEKMVSDYDELKLSYENRVADYESRLSAYNTKVQRYNEEGGAPPSEYENLNREQESLDNEQRNLNNMIAELNSMVDQINSLGSQGNQLIETYNKGVDSYNQTFGESREFTQGDYQGDFINIYTFATESELELVLAHELGHALHLDHVEGEQSVMYYLIGEQPQELDLSEYDLAEFNQVCGSGTNSFFERLKIALGL